jgi:HAD superfamily hydrolase (TIGR01549 family)
VEVQFSDVKLIIFDLDGTLLDAYGAIEHSLNSVRKRFNLEPISYSEVKRAVGKGDKVLIEDYFKAEDAEEALKLYRRLHRDALIKYGKLLPGAEEMLLYLKEKNYYIGLGTNRPAAFTELIIKHLNIASIFDYLACADKLGAFKPDPEMILKAIDTLGLDPKEVVYIGDMVIDIETAKNAKVRSIAITTGSSSREELEALSPTIIIDSLYKLKDFF